MSTLSHPHSCHIHFCTWLPDSSTIILNHPIFTFRFRLQDRCSSKQSDWCDSQFHNQLSHDICACRQINWNRNKTTTTFVGQIAKVKANVIFTGLRFSRFFFNLPGFFSIEKKKASSKYVAPIVSYDRECIQKL
jgi:hypothetical protein